jgi:hypothetical protein
MARWGRVNKFISKKNAKAINNVVGKSLAINSLLIALLADSNFW